MTACAFANNGSFATFDWNQTAGDISKVGTNAEGQWVARSHHSQG